MCHCSRATDLIIMHLNEVFEHRWLLDASVRTPPTFFVFEYLECNRTYSSTAYYCRMWKDGSVL